MTNGDTREPRPLDLVALVTFDGEVAENQAVTRDRLGRPPEAPHPLSAAIEHWLGRGRHTWVSLRGRELRGIATAREVTPRSPGVGWSRRSSGAVRAWEIDALIDADAGGDDGDTSVLADLLRQATAAATNAGVSHVLLRTRWDSPAAREAQRAGFRFAHLERLWTGTLGLDADADADGTAAKVAVREACEADEMALFQLYNRATPVETRAVLAMTLEEYRALRERRWAGRHPSVLVATVEDRITGSLRYNGGAKLRQFDLLVEAGSAGAAGALLDAATALHGAAAVTLVDASAGAVESLLRRRGLEPSEEYALLCQRSMRPLTETAPARSAVLPTGG